MGYLYVAPKDLWVKFKRYRLNINEFHRMLEITKFWYTLMKENQIYKNKNLLKKEPTRYIGVRAVWVKQHMSFRIYCKPWLLDIELQSLKFVFSGIGPAYPSYIPIISFFNELFLCAITFSLVLQGSQLILPSVVKEILNFKQCWNCEDYGNLLS